MILVTTAEGVATVAANNQVFADAGGSSRLNTAATNMVVGGLKFTGLALNIATDLARSLSTEAVSAVAKLDAEVTAQVCCCMHDLMPSPAAV